ncbi:MAG: glycosyl transferase [Flavobacteriaceae bacterium]|nr:glycosyl transferase [Flavobacteriaceae bacterium]
MPKFSVVISVYNKERYIANTLKSVLSQTVSDIEVVVLNDGSTDGSEAVIKSFLLDERIRYFSKPNRGAGAARNYVIQKADADYIALLDADDVWAPDYLEEQLRLIEKYPQHSVFATNSQLYQRGRILKRDYSIPIDHTSDLVVNFFSASYIHSIVNSSSCVVHRSVFETVGLYNPSIKSGQDTDLFIRMGLQYSVVFSPKICVTVIRNANSLSQRTKTLAEKASFEAYEDTEKTHPALKKFLDLNRYSLCLLAKMGGDVDGFLNLARKINLNNLNKKQRFLLKQPSPYLRYLFKMKEGLDSIGLRLTAFK